MDEKSRVWFDFGDGHVQEFVFDTEKEMDAFICGVSTAGENWGLDDYRQFETWKDVQEYLEDQGGTHAD